MPSFFPNQRRIPQIVQRAEAQLESVGVPENGRIDPEAEMQHVFRVNHDEIIADIKIHPASAGTRSMLVEYGSLSVTIANLNRVLRDAGVE